MTLNFLKNIIIILLLLPATSFSQYNPYYDQVSTVISTKKEGQEVLLSGKVIQWDGEKKFEFDDLTATIKILVNTDEKIDLIPGDEITLTGKVKVDEKGNKEILMDSFRKLRFVKDPSNCCKPEKE